MAIQVGKIIETIMEGSRIRDSKGIIPIFGVYLSLFFPEYYNRLSFEFEKQKGINRKTEDLLIQAAQECGYATFHGIRTSKEWSEVVAPMIECKEDHILGFAAIGVAFGWGDMTVKEIIPDEKLVISVTGSYESAGYLEKYGAASSGKCYMLRGVTAAFMDLLYGEDYPEGFRTFSAAEPLCAAKGDPYCEFIASRSIP